MTNYYKTLTVHFFLPTLISQGFDGLHEELNNFSTLKTLMTET
jgi:hypothetical protein